MIRWLDSTAWLTVSSADCTRAITCGTLEWRAIQARSNFSAVSEPPTSSWISRAIAARSSSTLVCRCWASSCSRCFEATRSRSALTRARRVSAASTACSERRHQPRQVVLLQVVGGAVAHRLDRGVLADLAGDEDEGHVARIRLQQLERDQAAEARHVVVGDDDVPGLGERLEEVGLGLDPARMRHDAAARQVRQQQLVVELGVLEMEDPEDAVPAG